MADLKVMIVEDEAIIALDIEDKLLQNGYLINGVVSSYEEALQHLLDNELPNIILMDILIEGEKNGIDLAESIKEKYTIPIVFITANSDKKILNELKRVTPYGFVNKPFDRKDIYTAIEVAHHKFLYDQSQVQNKNELRKLNEDLEQKIKIRTKELIEKNEHLNVEIKLRNEVEKSLFFSERLYRNTINNLGSGLTIVNPEGVVVTVNNSLCETLNYSKEELEGFNIRNVLSSDLYNRLFTFFSENGNGLWFSESQITRKDGSLVWCKLYVSISYTDKENFNYLFSIIDIHLQKINEKLFEEERKQRIKSFIEGEEKERKRLSRELHDGLGQRLTAAKLNLGVLCRDSSLLDTHKSIVNDSKCMIEEIMHEVREISQNLTPTVLSDYGIEEALKLMVEKFRKSDVTFFLDVFLKKRLPVEIETALYRITQESLNNVMKYAHSEEVSVVLKDVNKGVFLSIKDEGIGFDVTENAFRRGHGLNNIRERCEAVHADFKLLSRPGAGTEIQVTIAL